MSLLAVADDVSPGTTYSAAQAAKLLGVSERRVRQLVEEGRLPADRDDEGRLRLAQEPVHAERNRRRTEARRKQARKEAPATAGTASPVDGAAGIDLEALIARITAAVLPRAIEAASSTHRAVEAQLSDALAAERAARAQAEARAAAAEAHVFELTGPPAPAPRQEAPRRSWLRLGRH
jgi:excisionase family DNA binding protein